MTMQQVQRPRVRAAMMMTLTMTMALAAPASGKDKQAGTDDEWADQPIELQAKNALFAMEGADNYANKREGGPFAARCVRLTSAAISARGADFLVVFSAGVLLPFTRDRVLADGSREVVGKLGDMKKYCEDQARKLWVGDASAGVRDALGITDRWFGADAEHDEDEVRNQLSVLAMSAQSCSDSVKGALAAGLPPSTELALANGKLPLGEAEARACKPLADAIARQQELFEAREEAERAPFKKLLRGDKLKLVLDKYLWKYGAYVKGCRQIDDAAAFARASTWYEIMLDESGLQPRWITRALIFKGDKLVGEKTRTGVGRTPPSKGCP